MGLNIGGNIKSIYFGGNVKEIWQGTNKLWGGEPTPVYDPSIVLCYYGEGLKSIGLAPSSGSQIANYDSKSPFDLEGTGWSGCPYIINSGSGIFWNQEKVLELQNKSITIEAWIKKQNNDNGSAFFGGFADANWNQKDLLMSYESSSRCYTCNSYVNTYLGLARGEWNHFAITSELVGTTRQIKVYVRGSLSRFYSGGTAEQYHSDFMRLAGHTSYRYYISQFCVHNCVKWTSDFTPPTKPYILGV